MVQLQIQIKEAEEASEAEGVVDNQRCWLNYDHGILFVTCMNEALQ